MLQRNSLGRVPPKPHTAFYDENNQLLMEVCITREGFSGPFSMLYYRTPPTNESGVTPVTIPGFCPYELAEAGDLKRRQVRTQDQVPSGTFLSGRRTLFVNDSAQVGVCKPTEPTRQFFANGDGDELYFVVAGTGVLESIYGRLSFREHDYLLVPKSTPYRFDFEGDGASLLVFEGRPWLGIPGEYRNRYGQLTDFAPYTHRDFRLPREMVLFDPVRHGQPPFEIVVKREDSLTIRRYDYWPHDVVGWDGAVYPVAFNIHDYQPKVGLVHLPPTIHVTFAGEGFVVCSFVPRVLDFHEKAIPCPYGHANVDMDELIYYVAGNFTSRKGVGSGSISLHPAGIPHGPHPGTYEASIGARRTAELAVMCDAYSNWRMTTVAQELEDADYHLTWVER